MVYMGSKNRIAKDILPFMTPHLNGDNFFVDVFCGGCNLIDKLDYNKKHANDCNPYLIALFKYLQEGGILPTYISKETYYEVKQNKDNYDAWYVGHIGFNCSRLGKFFDCWIGEQNGRNYQREHINNMMKQISKLQNVNFTHYDYEDLFFTLEYNNTNHERHVYYCDIPYKGTRQYGSRFNYDRFYSVVRQKSEQGLIIFISEYDMPDDFIPIWSKPVKVSLAQKKTYNTVEKLFVHKSIINIIENVKK